MNKKALVTGGGRGLGRAIAKALSKKDIEVTVISRTKTDSGDHFIVLDLLKKDSPEKLIDQLKNSSRFPDIIIHNLGGTMDFHDPLGPIEKWEEVWRLNLGVAIQLNNFLIPNMQKKKWGRVVHISSLAATKLTRSIAYCSAKAALDVYVKGITKPFLRDNIVVSSVSPRRISTEDDMQAVVKQVLERCKL